MPKRLADSTHYYLLYRRQGDWRVFTGDKATPLPFADSVDLVMMAQGLLDQEIADTVWAACGPTRVEMRWTDCERRDGGQVTLPGAEFWGI